ncbi:olfactory receptor 2K2-like protein [Lates japonicus]|uniref:Olfactory receptor 2K2-like protein n=1 Tax=Lates japonicus TaxID=270547 RepID=A0AAD3NI73_LATJO|nr:olfactory receptor 2K2-like protein [Lates japonicus]
MHFLTGERRIAYIPAIAQAFSVHTYGVAVQTILAAMAYDRYHAIMTSARLHCCCALAWFVAVLCIAVLFGFMNVPLCGNIIKHVYSTNLAILSLACRSTPISNIYVHLRLRERRIAYIPAIDQAFSVHTYGVAVQTILAAMAYVRY